MCNYLISTFILFSFLQNRLNAQVLFEKSNLENLGIVNLGFRNFCFVDFNNDGKIDIWSGNAIYLQHNKGQFQLFQQYDFHTGITQFADYDNDGDLDILSLRSKKIEVYQNKNRNEFSFKKLNKKSKIPPLLQNQQLKDATWLDINNDQLLDLYISNYEYPTNSSVGQSDFLWINKGKSIFRDISIISGIGNIKSCSRGIAILDYNEDGLQDIYVSNYRLQKNILWSNNENIAFKDISDSISVAGQKRLYQYGHTIGAAVGDIDGNGHQDIFIPITHHLGYPGDHHNHLFLNTGPPNFEFYDFNIDEIVNAEIGSSPIMVDYDNDGDLDIFFINLYGRPLSRIFLYQNNGGVFKDVTHDCGIDPTLKIDFAHFIDINADGILDFITNIGSGENYQTILYFGKSNGNKSVQFSILNEKSAFALGTKIKIWCGDQMQSRYLHHTQGNGYGSMLNTQVHFGTQNFEVIDSVEVIWTDGSVNQFFNLETSNAYEIRKKKGIKKLFALIPKS